MKTILHRNFRDARSLCRARRDAAAQAAHRVQVPQRLGGGALQRCWRRGCSRPPAPPAFIADQPFGRILADINVGRQHISNQFEPGRTSFGATLFGIETTRTWCCRRARSARPERANPVVPISRAALRAQIGSVTPRASRATPWETRTMKLCRYDDDRLGVVIGDMVHDVTAAQTEIRASTPYAAKVDPVVAALPAWRAQARTDGEGGARQADRRRSSCLSPVARPPKILAAPTNYGKHIEEMQKFRDTDSGAGAVFARHREGRHFSEIQHLAGRAVRGHPDALSRPAQRPRGRARA